MAKNKRINSRKENEDGNSSRPENKAIIKIDMHCDGCVRDIEKCIWNSKGVQCVETIREKATVNVIGDERMNPIALIKNLEKKTNKKPMLLSPQKDDSIDKKCNKKKSGDDDGNLILNIDPPCEGCFNKTMKLIKKKLGAVRITEVSADKDSITVKGEKKALEAMTEKLPKTVKIVIPKPPKKEGGDGKGKKTEVPLLTGWNQFGYPPGYDRIEFQPSSMFPLGYGPIESQPPSVYAPGYGSVEFQPDYTYRTEFESACPYYPGDGYAPQMFTDENPLACSLM